MKNTDDAIEQVLTGLRTVEIPAGMERRILQAMQDGEAEGCKRRSKRRWNGARFWMLATAGMIVVFGISWMLRDRRTAQMSIEGKRQVAPRKVIEVQTLYAETVKQEWVVRRQFVAKRRERVRGDGARDGFVPEAPLTEEERLLLRIAHQGDPVELASVSPIVQETRDEKERMEFQSFFEPERPVIEEAQEDGGNE